MVWYGIVGLYGGCLVQLLAGSGSARTPLGARSHGGEAGTLGSIPATRHAEPAPYQPVQYKCSIQIQIKIQIQLKYKYKYTFRPLLTTSAPKWWRHLWIFFNDGEDNFEEVFDDGKDIFEKVFDDGEDIFEEVFDDGQDIFEEVFCLVI